MDLVKQPKKREEQKQQRDNAKAEYTAKTKILLKNSLNVPLNNSKEEKELASFDADQAMSQT